MRLRKKCAIVTGGAAGIGEASTRLFAAEGATVVAVDRNSNTLHEVVNSIQSEGFQCHALVADVSTEADCKKVVQWTAREFGSLDVLFNNAGVVHQGTLLETQENEWDEAMQVNVKSMFWMCWYALPLMQRQKSGSIINMSSVAGVSGIVNRGVYSVSKAAVVGLTLSLAADFVRDGIRVNCICPATVDTPSLRERIASAPDPKKAEADFLARQPMGRFGHPEEIAALALYLAAEESGYMTGQALVIDGGMTLYG
ncbi:glucose 1-dehydrogenase [Acidobacteria bacterium AH-259-G07]|nr:glucose 1-dehydrogenase [Acidobacteria bacterium AH-259-G07]